MLNRSIRFWVWLVYDWLQQFLLLFYLVATCMYVWGLNSAPLRLMKPLVMNRCKKFNFKTWLNFKTFPWINENLPWHLEAKKIIKHCSCKFISTWWQNVALNCFSYKYVYKNSPTGEIRNNFPRSNWLQLNKKLYLENKENFFSS